METINGFEIEGRNIYKIPEGVKLAVCPKCSHDRKPSNQKVKCLSVFWDTGLGQCNHCGERIQLHKFKSTKKSKKEYLKPQISTKISPYTNEFLKGIQDIRCISESTLKRFKVTQQNEWMPQVKKEVNCIAFNYWLNDELINIKFRGANKSFKLVSGAEKIFYNLDQIRTEKECIIVEGEFDALSFGEAGINNVVSVPNGFGIGNLNLDYLDDYYDYFDNKEKIYIAVDNDEAGINGKEELIRRFGAEKCHLVNFEDCKDANEYLIKYGVAKLRNTITTAEEIPLEHIETLTDYEDKLDDFFLNGCPKGYVTGMEKFDDMYSIEDGQFCIVTGTPQAGKSEFVDAMCLGYALKYGFKTAFCSPENKPNMFHGSKLVKKVLGKTPTDFKDNKYQMSKDFVRDNFIHIDYDDGYDLQKVLKKFGELVKRKGIKVFVIDPFNKVKLKGASGNINEYTNEYLNEIDLFCKKYKCLVYLVAHPTKMQKEENSESYKMATAYDIKGGGEFFDMSYHIIALRKVAEYKLVQIKTLKVKFQHLGAPDKDIYMGWDTSNGRYKDIDWDPTEDEHRVIDKWDDHCYLVSEKEQETKPKIDVFENANSDDFENSVFEGQTSEVPF